MLSIENLNVYHGYVHAVKDLTLEIKSGELSVILGANGAGKSTLLETIAGLNSPHSGKISFQGNSLHSKTPARIVRQGISLVPENREIFSSLSVADNLMLGAYHRYKNARQELNDDMDQILDLFPDLRNRKKELAGRLSGGLQQMLAIGRGLMSKPALLLLDEPSIGLAPMVAREIMATLVRLKDNGMTILLVEQNTKAALRVSDYVFVMERGSLTRQGNPLEMDQGFMLQEAYFGKMKEFSPAVS